jgi:hypothetical protein
VNLQVNRPTTITAAMLLAGVAVGAAVAVAGPRAVWIAAGAAVVVGLLRSPGVALALYLLVPPFLKGLLQPLIPVDLTMALGFVCIIHVAYGIVAKPVSIKMSALVLWCAVLAMITVGSLYAPDQSLAMSRVQSWVGLVFLPLLVAFWVAGDQREVERFIWTCLAVGLVVTLLAVLAFTPSQRLLVGFSSTISVGRASLMIPIITFFYVVRDGPRWIRPPLIVIAPLTVVVAFAAGARGPLILFFALVGALSIWHLARGRRISQGTVLGAAAAVLVLGSIAAVVPMPSISIDRFTELAGIVAGADTAADGSLEARLIAANLSVAIFEDHPALGAGTGAFTFRSRLVPAISGIENPHDILLEIAADWGVMGLGLLAVLVLAAIRRRPAARVWTAVWGLFLFFLLNAMLGSFFDNRAFWGFGLLLLAAPVAARSRRPDTERYTAGPPVPGGPEDPGGSGRAPHPDARHRAPRRDRTGAGRGVRQL